MYVKRNIMQIDKKIYDEINEYCKDNGLKTKDFIHKLLKEAFLKEKYGDSPFQSIKLSKIEDQACGKIKEIIENQTSVPVEIREVTDEHFFDMLNPIEVKEDEKNIVQTVYEENKNVDTPLTPSEEIVETPKIVEETPKPRVKKKRTLK